MTPMGYEQTPGPHRVDAPAPAVNRQYTVSAVTTAGATQSVTLADVGDVLTEVQNRLVDDCTVTIVPREVQ